MLDAILDFATSQLGVSILVIVLMINVILGGAAYLILLERRGCGWVQDRCGPNRTGPLGLLQPLADGFKLFVKEDYIPAKADRVLFVLAPAMAIVPAFIGFAIIPWGGGLELAGGTVKVMGADLNIGIIYLVATASLGVYGIVLGGWASNNKYSFLGGLRASAQMVSYEIPMGLALLCIILTAGTVRADEIVATQLGGGWWYLLQHPVAAILFYTCMLAEANRAPFDLAEAEQELVGGWHTEYSSMKWALYFMGEYAHLIVGGAFFTVLFLGGWSINPTGFGPDLPVAGGLGLVLLQVAVTLGKVFAMVLFTIVLRWTIPRFRFDQLMRLAWEGMIPIALVLLLVTSAFVFLGWIPWIWLGSLGVLAIIYGVQPLMPKREPNHRVALIGSRFSPASERG
jgi:NADH-quinone oxidoreductase subunit H